MSDNQDLQRFVEAQEPVIEQVLQELRVGNKEGHWMWFIFPQLKGLGHSQMATYYGLASRNEAERYLEHPVLGQRLAQCTELVNNIQGRSIDAILGSPDNLKFRSCMTLFINVSPRQKVFQTALDKYFGGEQDQRTLDLL